MSSTSRSGNGRPMTNFMRGRSCHGLCASLSRCVGPLILTCMLILLRGSLPTTGNQPTTFTSGLRGLRSSKRLPLGHLTGSAVGQESSEDASAWSVREMRAFLDTKRMMHTDCFEKRELLDRVQSVLASGEA